MKIIQSISIVIFLGVAIALIVQNPMAKITENQPGDNLRSIVVVDYRHRQVRLQAPAKRIIALAPHIVENLYSAGAGQAIVGVVEYCDYPEEAKSIAKVGAISAFSFESMVALKPDLVIVWESAGAEKLLNKLEAFGIPIYVSDPKSLKDISRSIRDYGRLAGTSEKAEVIAEKFDRDLDELEMRYASRLKRSVLYEVWHQPLQTINDDHIISDVIRLCGGKNIFGDAVIIAPKIGMESVVARDPDLIITSGIANKEPAWLNGWEKWPNLKAVSNGHVYAIPADLIQRHTVRILEGAALMCEQLERTRP
jgi:iron complex transport system substrate-binding protein